MEMFKVVQGPTPELDGAKMTILYDPRAFPDVEVAPVTCFSNRLGYLSLHPEAESAAHHYNYRNGRWYEFVGAFLYSEDDVVGEQKEATDKVLLGILTQAYEKMRPAINTYLMNKGAKPAEPMGKPTKKS